MHEKYIKRGNKIFGPYYYNTYRENGQVKTSYVGKASDVEKNKLSYNFILISMLFSLLILFLIYNQAITGNAIILDKTTFSQNEKISGVFEIKLNEGELIPSDSPVSIQFGNQNVNMLLRDFIQLSKVNLQEKSGDYFSSKAQISGSGPGYGFSGRKTEYPEVQFMLEPEILAIQEAEQREISGSAKYGKDFEYDGLANLVPGSVQTNGKQLSDDSVSIIKENGRTTVSTDYYEETYGFGKDYLGNEQSINLDLSELNLYSETEGTKTLLAELSYNNVILASETQTVKIVSNETSAPAEQEMPIVEVPELPAPSIQEVPLCGQSDTAGMISYWRGENNTNDTLGRNNGSAISTLTYSPGVVGLAFNTTNGLAEGYVEIPDHASLNPITNFTVEVWGYHNKNDDACIVAKDGFFESKSRQYEIRPGTGYSALLWTNNEANQYTLIGQPLNTKQWYHYAIVYNGTAFIAYLNGTLDNYTAATGNVASSNPGPLRIGTINSTSIGSQWWNGSIDEVAYYNRSLSSAEISAHYTRSLAGNAYCIMPSAAIPSINFIPPTPNNGFSTENKNAEIKVNLSSLNSLSEFKFNWNGTNYTLYNDSLLLMFNFDNNSAFGENATLAADVSKYSNNGTVFNGTLWNSSGKFGGAMQFDGINGYINVSGIKSLSKFTAAAWIRTTTNLSLSSHPTILSTGVGDRMFLRLNGYDSSSLANVECYNARTSWSGDASTPYTNITDGRWHFIACTDNETKITVYIDNNSTTSSSSNNPILSSRSLHIGTDYDDRYYFNGSIDEVRMWNLSLSANEVKQLYYSNLQKYDQTQWYFYSNQSNLSYGAYTYSASAKDTSGNFNSTETRTLNIVSDATSPLISFVSPTPTNGTSTTNKSLEINVSVSEVNLNEFKFSWNTTNYTFYNDSLILMFNFDNISAIGDNATFIPDLSKYGNNGTFVGNLSKNWTLSGKFNGAYIWDDLSANYVSLQDSAFSNLENMTIEGWIYNLAGGKTTHFLWGHDIVGGTVRHDIRMDSTNPYSISTTSQTASCSSPINLVTERWYHIAVTYNGSYNLYVNGTLQCSVIGNSYKSFGTSVRNRIGSYIISDEGMKGMIDEFRLWNRTLSVDEIKQHYYSNLQKFNSTQWYFYSNQSNLGYEAYTYSASAKDTSGNFNSTETRTLNIVSDLTAPSINFTSPTPANGTSTTNRFIPVLIEANDANYKNYSYNLYNSTGLVSNDKYFREDIGVSGGNTHTCILLNNGNVFCQGRNVEFQSTGYSGGDAIEVSSGIYSTSVLLNNGNVIGWGYNGNNQINPYYNGDAVQMSAGRYHTCALLRNGNVTCWGNNGQGRANNYTQGNAVGVSAGALHTCILLNNGNAFCQGYNDQNQSNNYTGGNAISISGGQQHTCALLNNGNITCWGDNEYNQSNNYTQGNAVGVSAGNLHTCALLNNGNITCWGDNSYSGQANNYTKGDAIGVSAGGVHTCALLSNGNLTCWGFNTEGQAANYTSGNAKKQAPYAFLFLNNVTYYLNATACDSFNNCNSTETRQINILEADTTAPSINFTSPTPANGTSTTNTSVQINISIIEAQLGEMKLNWNSTNYTFYDDSLILMIDLNNNSAIGENSSYVADASKYGNNGTINLSSSPVWNSTGKYGGAYTFNGTTTRPITIKDSASLRTPNMTVALWVNAKWKPDESSNPQNIPIGKWRDSSPSQNSWRLEINGSGQVIWFWESGSTGKTGFKIPENEWHYVAVTHDNSNVKIYIDGDVNLTQSASSLSISRIDPLDIGVAMGHNNAINTALNGSVDGIRIWSRALSASEIQQQYYSNLQKYNSTQWHFYSNQSNISAGTYTYSAYAKDAIGNENLTEVRTLNIQAPDTAAPSISFISPTPTSGTNTKNRFIPVLIEANDANYKNYSYYLYNSTGLVSNDKYYSEDRGVSAGQYHTCALLNNGNITCWGYNNNGRAANYTQGDAIGVSAGGAHTCALLNNGNITCWGWNDDNQSNNYIKGDAIGVSAGGIHTCALLNNGNITCWGLNEFGQANNYTQGNAIGVSLGNEHTCALLNNGNTSCWGLNDNNQSNNYTQGDAIGVSAGNYDTCALLNNGNITCWGITGGGSFYGQTNNYTQGNAVGVSAGAYHTCALLNNGNITCWGNNANGQANNYTKGDAVGVSLGNEHTCALLNNGNITCWGNNANGQAINYTLSNAKKQSFYAFQFLNDGAYYLNATACDSFNNCNSTETRTITILESVPPSVSLISPENGANITQALQQFSCNATNAALSNMTLYVWNSTGSLNFTNTTQVTGIFNQSSWNYTLPYEGSFKWNCLALDSANNPGWAASNYSLTYNTSIITSCQNLDIENKKYYLQSNVSSAGTCFNILANNITLDCQKYQINYSASIRGYAINSSFNFTIIKNCIIKQTNPSLTNAYGIRFSSANNGTVYNTNITTSGDGAHCIYLQESKYNTISNCTINASLDNADGTAFTSNSNNNIVSDCVIKTYWRAIDLSSSNGNQILRNNLASSIDRGIVLSSSSSNNIINNSIRTFFSDGYGLLASSSSNNTISNNSIITSGNSANGIRLTTSSDSNIVSINNFNSVTTSIYVSGSSGNKGCGNTVNNGISQSAGNYVGSTATSCYVWKCTDLNPATGEWASNGTYFLLNNVSSAGTCFNNLSDNIGLDCQENSIIGSGASTAYGINIQGYQNIAIKNCEIINFSETSSAAIQIGYAQNKQVINISLINIVLKNDSSGMICAGTSNYRLSRIYIQNMSGNVLGQYLMNLVHVDNSTINAVDFDVSADGIGLDQCLNNKFENITLRGGGENGFNGISLAGSSNNTKFTNVSIYSFGYGAGAGGGTGGSANNNTFINLKVFNSQQSDVVNNFGTILEVYNLTLSTINFSYIMLNSASVRSDTNTKPANSDGKQNISYYANISGGYVIANISYKDSDWQSIGITEGSLRLYKHNGTNWVLVPGSGIDRANNVVYANMTSFSVFAPMGEIDITPPSVSLISPANNTQTSHALQTFSCNATDDMELANITLYIWNSTGSLNYSDTQNIAGIFNQKSWNVTLPYEGSFKWNCFASDSAGNSTFAAENWTLNYNTNLITSCQNLDIADKAYSLQNNIASNESCFNVLANNITLDCQNYNLTGNGTGYGINITGFNSTLKRCNLLNFGYGFYSNNSHVNAINLTIASTKLSFDAVDVEIKPAANIPADSSGLKNIGTYLEISKTSDKSQILMNISYAGASLTGIDENTLKLYKAGGEGSWNSSDVDTSLSAGKYTSIALGPYNKARKYSTGNNYPRIAYQSSSGLMYAEWNGTDWNLTSVDTGIRIWNSLALDSNNYPRIASTDGGSNDLKYYKYNGTAWSGETVESAGIIGSYCSLALDSNDYPQISYCDETNGDLKYARWNGTAWNKEIVDSANSVGYYTSIAIDSNNYPHIAYQYSNTIDLKYARWNGTAWKIETIDSATSVGAYTSIALDSNDYPHIAYYSLTGSDLKFAEWNGTDWSVSVADTSGAAGQYSSLALDSNNYPHIAHSNGTNGDVRFAEWNGTAWKLQTVHKGSYTSIALDAFERPQISSSYNFTGGGLRYAFRDLSWILANTTSSLNGVDKTNKIVYANLTEFSVFGIFGNPSTLPPNVSLISPADGTNTTNALQAFSCNATSNSQLLNMTLYLWNSTNDIINQTANAVSGIFNQSSWNVTLPYGDSFRWNCLAVESASNPGWAAANYSLNYNTSLVTSCQNLSIANKAYYLQNNVSSGGTCFKILVDNITLDCAGFNITGTGAGYGINITGANNALIKNCPAINFLKGISFKNSNNSKVQNSTFIGVQDGAFIYDSNNLLISDSRFDGSSFEGLRISYSPNFTISNSTIISSAGNGIDLDYSDNSHINALIDVWNYGIKVEYSENNTITFSNITSQGYGISIGDQSSSMNNLISDSNISATGAASEGIYISNSDNNTIKNCRINAAYYGIDLTGVSNIDNLIEGADVHTTTSDPLYDAIYISGFSDTQIISTNASSNSEYGVYLASTTSNTIINSSFRGAVYDFYSDAASDTAASNIDFSTANISFNSLDVAINKTSVIPADTGNLKNISKYIDIDSTGAGSWILLNISYANANISGVRENTLRIYKYNGLNWILANTTSSISGIDNVSKVVYANITSFSTFGILGEGEAGNEIQLLNCQNLDTSDKLYLLQNNVNSNGTCFNIQANNITLDCQNYSVIGNKTGYGLNITWQNSSIIKNCIIRNFTSGIYLNYSINSSIINTNLSNNSYDFYSAGSSLANAINLSISSATVSFSSKDVWINSTYSAPANIGTLRNIGKNVDVSSTSSSSWILLNMSYSGADWQTAKANESSLKIYRFISGTPDTTNIEYIGNSGERFSSIAIDSNGYPHIAYFNDSGKNLKYARWNGTAWNITNIEYNGGSNIQGLSLALDSNDYAHIVYFDYYNYQLKYAKWTGSSWSISTIEAFSGLSGAYSPSIALDSDNYPHISYYNHSSSGGDLKYARWNGTAWNKTLVDSAGNVGWYSSIALDSNNYPHISYYDYTNSKLKFAEWNGTSWNTTSVISAGYYDSSLVLGPYNKSRKYSTGNNYPHITYYLSSPEQDLKYIKWNGTGWQDETVDYAGDIGRYNALALDSAGYPNIAYNDNTNADLKFARWNGTGWLISVTDSVGTTGYYLSSIALDSNDYAHIAYYNYTGSRLMYAKIKRDAWNLANASSLSGVDIARKVVYANITSFSTLGILGLTSAPTIVNASINPSTAYKNDTLNCTIFVRDLDSFNLNVNFTWFNGTSVYNSSIIQTVNETSASFALPQGIQVKKEIWTCSVQADDSVYYSDITNVSIRISNYLPIQSQPVLNSTSGKNLTTENITCYPQNMQDIDLEPVYPIFNWYKNNQPIAILNLPFESNISSIETGALRDYSGRNNGGTLSKWTSKQIEYNYYGDTSYYSTSIAIDSNNNPHVAYYDDFDWDLTYAKWTGTAWDISVVDSTNNVGRYSSLALDSNNYPHISYYYVNGGDLRVARWNGTGWNITTVDSANDVGKYSSIALDSNDYEHVSYYDNTGKDLKFAEWNGTDWNTTTVDSSTSDVGSYTSIALDSTNYPHISYIDASSNHNVRYAKYNGTGWTTTNFTYYQGWNMPTSIALDSNNYPHITSYGSAPSVQYARWTGTKWNVTAVDVGGDVGAFCSLTLGPYNKARRYSTGNNYPHISYTYWTGGDLRYARWNGTAWIKENVDTNNTVGFATSIALDSNGYAHISYYDYTNQYIRYAKQDPPKWTAGKTGGAYSFNGMYNSISANYSSSLVTPYISVSAWIKTSATGNRSIAARNNVWQLKQSSPSGLQAKLWTASGIVYINKSIVINNSQWRQVAFTYDGSTARLYIDGRLNYSQSVNSALLSSSSNLEIGSLNNTEFWNGTIDNVKVYNRSLSSEEISRQFYEENNSLNISTITSQEIYSNENWTCQITPNDLDSNTDGQTLNSNNLTIRGIVPPNVRIIYPLDNSRVNAAFFRCNATGDSDLLSNITLYVWNSTGSLNFTNTTSVSGIFNETNFTTTLADDGLYRWNCLAFDASGNSNFSITNYTFTLDRVLPLINFTYPTPNNSKIINTSYADINISVNENVSSCTLNFGQNVFNTTFGTVSVGSTTYDYGSSVKQTSDGGYIVAGYNSTTPDDNILLIKLTPLGGVEWNKTIKGGGKDFGQSVQQTTDGGYILLGYTNIGGAGYDFWLIKTDSSGNIQWNKTYGGAGDDRGYTVQQTSDGGYALLGYSSSFDISPKIWLIKTNETGDMSWNKTYGVNSSSNDYSGRYEQKQIQTSDGGYIILGTTSYTQSIWLIKTDSNGQALWNKTFNQSNVQEGYSVQQTSDNGYIITGRLDSGANINAWLIKTDSSGNHEWNKTYGGTGVDVAFSVAQTSDKGYILGATTSLPSAGDYDFWLIKTNSTGGMLWNKTYGGSKSDTCYSIQQTSDKGFVMCGSTRSFGPQLDVDSVWIVKTDSDGNISANYSYAMSIKNADNLTSANYSLSNITNGFYDYYARCADIAGNVNISEARNLTVDILFTANTNPVVSAINITPSPANIKDNLTCNATLTDKEQENLTAYWTWYKNNAAFLNGFANVTNGTNSAMSTIYSSNLTKGDWKCSVTPFDGIINGSQVNASITIQNSAPNVTLILPLDQDFKRVNFSSVYNASDEDGISDIANCTLWKKNETASWMIYNITFNPSNQTSVFYLVLENQTEDVLWNVSCADSSNAVARSETRLIHVDALNPIPIFNNPLPDNSSVQARSNNTFALDVRIWNHHLKYSNLEIRNSTSLLHSNYSDQIAVSPQVAYYNFTYPFYVGSLDSGNYTVYVNATDWAGNFLETSRRFRINSVPSAYNAEIISDDVFNRTYANLTGNWTFQDIDDAQVGYETRWYRNNAEVLALKNSTTASNAYTTKSENWIFSARVYDGYDWSSWANSSAIIIQNTPPAKPALASPANNSFNPIITLMFNYTSTDADFDVLSYYLLINGLLNKTTATNYTSITFNEGLYNWSVISNDGTDNSTLSDIEYFAVDLTSPSASLISPANGITISTLNNTFSCSASDNFALSNITLYVWNSTNDLVNKTSSPVSGTSSQINVTVNLTRGNYKWNCIAYDAASRFGWNPVNYTLTINAAPSITSIKINPYSLIAGKYINLTCNATLSDYEQSSLNAYWTLYKNLNVNLSGISAVTSGLEANLVTVNNLYIGIGEVWNCTAIPNDGFVNGTSASNKTSASVNNAPNITSIYLWPQPTYNDNDLNCSAVINDSENDLLNVNFTWYKNSVFVFEQILSSQVSGSNLTSTFAKTNFLPNNILNCTVKVSDLFSSDVKSVKSTIIDIETPVSSLISPINGILANRQNQTFACSATDNNALSNITLYVWNSTNSIANASKTDITGTSNQTSWNITLIDGNYKWNCLVSDADSNLDWDANYTLTIDTVTPTITVSSPQSKNYTTKTIGLNVSSNALDIGKWWYNLNNAGNLTFTPNITFTALEGSNAIYVYVNDTAGNLNLTNLTFVVDTIPPYIGFVYPLNNSAFNRTQITISITNSSDAVAVWWYNGTNNLTYTDSLMYNFSEELHVIYAYTNDSNNNINQTSVTFLIDLTAPNITIVYPANNATLGSGTISTLINISTNDVAVCRYSITNDSFDFADGTIFTNTNAKSSTFTFAVLDGHSYTLYYKCNDTAGNINNESANHTFHVMSPGPGPGCNPSWACDAWGSCVNKKQSRSCSDGCGHYNTESQDCCNELWSCGGWSNCINGQQTRSCSDLNGCGTTNSRPPLTQTCTCTENWNCTDWTDCISGMQSRTCNDLNNCGTIFTKPTTSQGCVCQELWNCTSWSACVNRNQTRTCSDLHVCGTNASKPAEKQPCSLGECTDGTFYNSCSINKPKYCLAGNLVDRCSECGCDNASKTCQPDGTCTFECEDDKDCDKLGKGYECKNNKCWLEEKECNSDSDCPSDKYCDNGECKKFKKVISETPASGAGAAGAPAPLFGIACISEWNCSEIGECQLHYSLSNLISVNPGAILEGKAERSCIDKNNCAPPRLESIACQKPLPIDVTREIYCNEPYINIYDKNGTLIATIREGDIGSLNIDLGTEIIGVQRPPCVKKEKPFMPSPDMLAPVPTTLAQISKGTLALALLALIILIVGEAIILLSKPAETIALSPSIQKLPEFPEISSKIKGIRQAKERIKIREIKEARIIVPEAKALPKIKVPEHIQRISGIQKELAEVRRKMYALREAKLENLQEQYKERRIEFRKSEKANIKKEAMHEEPREIKRLENELSKVREKMDAAKKLEAEQAKSPYQARKISLDSIKESLKKKTEEIRHEITRPSKEMQELEEKLNKVREKMDAANKLEAEQAKSPYQARKISLDSIKESLKRKVGGIKHEMKSKPSKEMQELEEKLNKVREKIKKINEVRS